MERHRYASGVAVSSGFHLFAVGLLILAARHIVHVLRPVAMPGTPLGAHMMLTYRLGGPSAAQPSAPLPVKSALPVRPAHPLPGPVPAPPASSAPPGAAGTGSGGDSALGDENLRIALPQIHPRPQPDLSSLPHGTAGDVIVDIVIDDAGKVTGTTLVKGLGGSVDGTVLQALRDWTFTPANRNGQNVASEQEILIHYERG